MMDAGGGDRARTLGENPAGRYAGTVGHMDGDDLDLLECLLRIDLHQAVDARAQGLIDRIVDAGLADRHAEGLSLTHAGVQRCKSLQHRVASDEEAVRLLRQRGLPDAVLQASPDAG
jgi:hypothetical protein